MGQISKEAFPLEEIIDLYRPRYPVKDDSHLKALVDKIADLLGWNINEGRATRINELLWELGLLKNRQCELRLPDIVFYARTMFEKGTIPISARS